MSEEKTENPGVKNTRIVNDLLMKPFSLGWTREVVKRLVTNNKTPNCDIYYFNPSKKKLRSMAEVKLNLTDGLTAECFSFKREPLGLSPDYETVRDAKARGRGTEKKKTSNPVRKQVKHKTEEEEVKDSEKELKKKKTETDDKDIKPDAAESDPEIVENGEKSDKNNRNENQGKEESENKPEIKLRRAKSNVKQPDESKTFNSKKKSKTKAKAKPAKSTKSIRLQAVKKRKTVLRTIMNAKQAKQAKLVASRKVLKKIVSKKVVPLKGKLSKIKIDKKSAIKTKKNNVVKLKTAKRSIKKSKTEEAKEPETNENDKKSAANDLKSIVEKNIVKYREMREKQKLGLIKAQGRSPSQKISVATVSRSRLEPISKNKSFYLKPIEKGWRRELVYRTNCAKGGQQADVYYFHPSGKKLRSFREISENLTHGLSIECFTFRKEPIGIGEPSEVIRNARAIQKN